MGDNPLYQWEMEGSLHVWHYPERVKGMEGWHLNADEPGCRSLADLVDRMLAAEGQVERRIPVSVPHRALGKGWEPATKLLLRYLQGEGDDNHWHLELRDGNVLALTLGAAKMRQLKDSLLGLPLWKDDFALGPDVDLRRAAGRGRWNRECLWFWTKVE